MLRGGAALAGTGASVAWLAACSTKRRRPAPTESPGAKSTELRADVEILQATLDVEHVAIFAYAAGLPLLTGAVHSAAKRFLAQEYAHAAELSALIHQGGGKPNLPRPSYPLGSPSRPGDVLALLHDIERRSIRAYLDAIPRLSQGIVRSTVASILANEAEHMSVLRGSLGMQPVPSAFVTVAE